MAIYSPIAEAQFVGFPHTMNKAVIGETLLISIVVTSAEVGLFWSVITKYMYYCKCVVARLL